MVNIKLKKAILLEKHKTQLNALMGAPFEKIIERFVVDLFRYLLGVSSGCDQAREWLLVCFHQYFGCGYCAKSNKQLEKLRSLVHGFSQPTK